MLDLALAVITGGRQHWYNDTGELVIASRPGDRCRICGEYLCHGEAFYRPEKRGFLCEIHDPQRATATIQ